MKPTDSPPIHEAGVEVVRKQGSVATKHLVSMYLIPCYTEGLTLKCSRVCFVFFLFFFLGFKNNGFLMAKPICCILHLRLPAYLSALPQQKLSVLDFDK